MFIDTYECGTRVYSTRAGPGHGCVLSVWSCAAAYCLPGRDVRSEFVLELVRYILRVCARGKAYVRAVRCSVWEAEAVYFVRVCVYVRRSACTARAFYHSS